MNRIQIKKTERGFTLIELMVIIAIGAVISAITIASVRGAKNNVDDKTLTQDFNELKVGLDQYKATCKTYPISLDSNANNSLSTTGNGCARTFGEVMVHLSDIDVDNKYVYIPLARSSSPSYCSGYWLAVLLDSSNGQLTNSENITPSELNTFLQGQSGWVQCSGSTIIPPVNGASANNYYGQMSSGVCSNPSSPTCI